MKNDTNTTAGSGLHDATCSSSSLLDSSKLSNKCLGGVVLDENGSLGIGSKSDLNMGASGTLDSNIGDVIDIDPCLHGDRYGSQNFPIGITDEEKLWEGHVLGWLKDMLIDSGAKILAIHHVDLFHGDARKLMVFMEAIGRGVTLVDDRDCRIEMRGPHIEVSWMNVKRMHRYPRGRKMQAGVTIELG